MTLKRGFFVLLFALIALTFIIHEAFLFRPGDPEWTYIRPFRWWLLGHGLAAAIAFLIVPLQFSGTIRARNLTLHRWIGRLYVAAVAVAGALSLVINLNFESAVVVPAGVAQGGLWILCTAFAWFAARNRAIAQHKLWAVRSYGLAFTFVATRLIPDLPFFPPTDQALADLIWALIAAAMVLPDLIFAGRAVLPWRRSPATSPLPQDAVVAER